MKVRSGWTRRKFLSLAATAAAAGHAAKPARAIALLGGDANSGPDWKSEGVLNLGKSPYAKLNNIPVSAVTIDKGFWSQRRSTNVRSSIPSMHEELVAHGRMTNFERLAGRSSEPQKGPVYSDSDIYKWLEAVAFALQTDRDLPLRQTSDAMIREVVAIQEPSGYLNTYYQGDKAKLRMLPETTQTTGHELYDIGHMLQASIAYYRATGDRTLLDAGLRFVDGFLLPGFGPGEKQTPIVAGHPEIEMALVELYRTTGDKQHLDLAGYILQGDNRVPLRRQQIVYMFCGIPFTSRTKLEGHAVRAMYACCGATDFYLETGDPAYWKTLETLWHDLSEHQMYVTGGVGARSAGEAFGEPYELPNARAYGESCAAIGNMMWNWRMLAATGEAKYTDVIERALYNGINSGMSLDGTTYCYRNPLAFDPTSGDKIRNPWYDTTCCPPNIERTLASLPGYFYSTAKDGVYVHLYDNSGMNWKLDSGTGVKLMQQTNYPWNGDVKLTVAPARAEEFTLYVRIPGWSKKTTVMVDGKPVDGVVPGKYLALKRHWTGASTVELSFDMRPQILRANPAVADDTGRVAIQRGPIVYCMEGLDQPSTESNTFPLYQAKLDGALEPSFRPDTLDGIVVLNHAGSKGHADAGGGLYEAAVNSPEGQPALLKLIPYYAWANRQPSAMQVWIPLSEA